MIQGATRTIWVIGGVAVLSLGAGLGLSRLIVSPAEAAAQAAPPEPEAITVPVEQRTLANDVVMRGDVLYEDPAAITVEAVDLGGPAVVTGHVPEVGSTVEAGQVVLEVTGRPVILLTGELPVYRTLRTGLSGPDVVQLKEALTALGIDPGNTDSDVYDAATAAAVVKLYDKVGYTPPTAGEEAEAAVDAAQEAVRSAQEQLDAARSEAATASAPLPRSELIRLQGAADSAKIRHDQAVAACKKPTDAMPCDKAAVIDTRTELEAARAARDEARAPADTSAANAMVESAKRMLSAAHVELNEARAAVGTPLPASEVVYLASTPRRVDAVDVKRGSTISGTPVMTVSGATLQISGTVSKSDAELLTADLPAVISLPDGTEAPGVVKAIGADAKVDGADGETPSGRTPVIVEPTDLTDEQRTALQGANVRVEIPVSSTGEDVLAVPIAALTAGPGGESRVEVMGADGETTLVDVEAGLAAQGFVQVTPLAGQTLEVGMRVVVGQTGGGGVVDSATDAPSTEDETTEDDATEEDATEEDTEEDTDEAETEEDADGAETDDADAEGSGDAG